MNSNAPNIDVTLLHEPILALLEEDRLRMHGNYGYSMESVFGVRELEAETIATKCLSETDPSRIAELYTQLCGLLFRSPTESRVIESADSLARVHEILGTMDDSLKAIGIHVAEQQIGEILSFVREKHRLLMQYLETNL
ncbi:hypothetical protein EXS65_02485 [Candidatus Peribacteria bacterium]|nr:hypothetical protein [Candidatus Peribacteria bacterium]